MTYLSGFMMKFSNKAIVTLDDFIKWQQFRQVCKKWHHKLCRVRYCKSTRNKD